MSDTPADEQGDRPERTNRGSSHDGKRPHSGSPKYGRNDRGTGGSGGSGGGAERRAGKPHTGSSGDGQGRDGKPYGGKPREGRPYAGKSGDAQGRDRKPYGAGSGDRKPYGAGSGDRKPYGAGSGDRKPYGAGSGDRKAYGAASRGGGPTGGRSSDARPASGGYRGDRDQRGSGPKRTGSDGGRGRGDRDQKLWTSGGRPARGDRDARDHERALTEEERMARELRSVRPRHEDPEIAEDIQARDLDKGARVELKTLSKDNADWVARHLVMAARLIEDDPEQAHLHALSAARRAGRIAVVRETLAITAYATGDFALALRELRTYRRISGNNDQLPLMVDSERGVGRPDRALELGRSVDRASLPVEVQVSLAIAMSGARLDQGQPEAALAELEIPQLDPNRAYTWSPDLFHAYADVLEELGRGSAAEAWRERATRAEDALGASLIGDEDETVDVVEEEYEFVDDGEYGATEEESVEGDEPAEVAVFGDDRDEGTVVGDDRDEDAVVGDDGRIEDEDEADDGPVSTER